MILRRAGAAAAIALPAILLMAGPANADRGAQTDRAGWIDRADREEPVRRTAAVARTDGPDASQPAGAPPLTFYQTNGDELVQVNPGWLNHLLSRGAVNVAGSTLRSLLDKRMGLANADLGYGVDPSASCLESLPEENLVALDTTPAWGVLIRGRRVPPCPRPATSKKIESDLDQLFEAAAAKARAEAAPAGRRTEPRVRRTAPSLERESRGSRAAAIE